MKQAFVLLLLVSCILTGCGKEPNADSTQSDTTPTASVSTEPSQTMVPTETAATEPVETVPVIPTVPATDKPKEPATTDPPATQPPATEETRPPVTEPPATIPPVTEPKPTQPPATEPPETEPAPTEPEETAPSTEPEETVPPKAAPTAEFKREVAQYAAYYINQYRAASGVPSCTVLSGMTQVAQYRASQLTYNYSHDTEDKREALAYYEYGRWVDATIVGLDPSASYYEADTSEAICAGFEGSTAEEMGKYIADMCRNSGSHWSYLGSANNLYVGVGVEYRAGSTYDWYACIMVGRTNYG